MAEIKLNGNGLYKLLFAAALGILLGIGAQIFREPKDTVSEKELTLNVLTLQSKIDAQTSEIVALRSSVNQQSVDIAGIASKVGATAHPVIAPH